MKPVYSVNIGSLKLSNQDGKQGGFIALCIESGVDQINEARLLLPSELEIVAELGDNVQISFGETKVEVVYTGIIYEIRRKADHVHISVVSQLSKLSYFHTNRSYEQRSCGQICKDLLEAKNITAGHLQEGIEYPAYTIENTFSAFEHLLILSKQNGFFLYADVKDKLTIGAPPPGLTHLFTYGKNILSFEQEEAFESVTGVEVFGESPLSHGQGKDAYSWVSSKEVIGSAGDKKGTMKYLFNPSLKDIDSTQVVAENILYDFGPGNYATISILGNPKVKLLDQFMVKDIPGRGSSGRYRCIEIIHKYEGEFGFVSQLKGKEL